MAPIGKIINSVLKSTGLRKVASNSVKGAKSNSFATYLKEATKKGNVVYAKDTIKLSDLETVAKKGSSLETYLKEAIQKGDVVYAKDTIKLSDLETVAKGTSKPKSDKVEVSIMKSFKERLSHAIDLLKYRKPTDFVSSSEVQQHLGELIKTKAKTVNVGLFKNNTALTDTMKKIDVSQLDTEIKNCRKLLDEIEII